MRLLSVGILAISFIASPAWAAPERSQADLFSNQPTHDVWHIDWLTVPGDASPNGGSRSNLSAAWLTQGTAQPLHAAAIEHSAAFQTRAKIHKIASFATLPLFAAELALGQSVYNGNRANKDAHIAVGSSLVALFMVNSVTGGWNLFGQEGRQDTKGRTLRVVHGLLMLAADAGFAATSASGPENENEHGGAVSNLSGRSTHRALAVTSISLGTVGYLVMLLGNH